MSSLTVPTRREDYKVAIVCALPEATDAVRYLLDKVFDERSAKLGKAERDPNVYNNGRMGRHNVVVCQIYDVGKAAASGVISSMWASYTNIEIVLLVGICDGLPSSREEKRQRGFGDVIISDSMMEYDRGKYLVHEIESKTHVKGHNREVATLLRTLKSEIDCMVFEQRLAANLASLQREHTGYERPHSLASSHQQRQLVSRESKDKGKATGTELVAVNCAAGATDEDPEFSKQSIKNGVQLHIGRFASGDMVLKAAEKRDELARKHDAIGFEMEAPGLWDFTVPCLVIKGISDFADSNKNDEWRKFSCATGAAAAKTFLTDWWKTASQSNVSLWAVPFSRNPDFVGRKELIGKLRSKILSPKGPRTMAMFGLGGIGKTDLAVELLHQMREKESEYSFFWISCTSTESVRQGYDGISHALGISDDNPSETRNRVVTHLEHRVTKWLLLLDNVDSGSIWEDLRGDLPKSENGRVVVTTRNRNVALDASCDIVEVPEPSEETALGILRKKLRDPTRLMDKETNLEFLKLLAHLPLAIVQAAAYLRRNEYIGLSEYMELFEKEESDAIALLDAGLDGGERYPYTPSPIATTWLISFSQIAERNPLAARYLKLMACLSHHEVPGSFFPRPTSEKERLEAVGDLLSFSFVATRDKSGPLTMHRLVRLATRNWMRQNKVFAGCLSDAAGRVSILFPDSSEKNSQLQRQFEKAEEIATEALKFGKAKLGEEDEDTIFVEALLMSIYQMRGWWDKAEELNRHVISVRRRTAPDHPNTPDYMAVAGALYKLQRKPEEAEITLSDALKMRKETLGPDHPDTVGSMVALASLTYSESLLGRAKDSIARLLQTTQRDDESNHDRLIDIVSGLASACQSLQQPKEAERLATQSLAMATELHGAKHPRTIKLKSTLANILSAQGRMKEAEDMMVQALDELKEVSEDEHVAITQMMFTLWFMYESYSRQEKASTREKTGASEKAEEMKQSVQDKLREEVQRTNSPQILDVLYAAAQSNHNAGKTEGARRIMKSIVQLANTLLGPMHSRTKIYDGFLSKLEEEIAKALAAAAVPRQPESTPGTSRRRDKSIPRRFLDKLKRSARSPSRSERHT
ncbi:hypothetical protein BDW74DRAFT_147925 [Aspergillus multicolor]|uniref:uncharacterized protein n=1 Tax=Aspergillus multicolor TaxID=41759 RepID=UPI003CCC9E19